MTPICALVLFAALAAQPGAPASNTIALPQPREHPCATPAPLTIFRTLPREVTAEPAGDHRLKLTAPSKAALARAEIEAEQTCPNAPDRWVRFTCTPAGTGTPTCEPSAAYGKRSTWPIGQEADWARHPVPPAAAALAAGQPPKPPAELLTTAAAFARLSTALLARACPGQRCGPAATACREPLARAIAGDPRTTWKLRDVQKHRARFRLATDPATALAFACLREGDGLTCTFELEAGRCRWLYTVDALHYVETAEFPGGRISDDSEALVLTGTALDLAR